MPWTHPWRWGSRGRCQLWQVRTGWRLAHAALDLLVGCHLRWHWYRAGGRCTYHRQAAWPTGTARLWASSSSSWCGCCCWCGGGEVSTTSRLMCGVCATCNCTKNKHGQKRPVVLLGWTRANFAAINSTVFRAKPTHMVGVWILSHHNIVFHYGRLHLPHSRSCCHSAGDATIPAHLQEASSHFLSGASVHGFLGNSTGHASGGHRHISTVWCLQMASMSIALKWTSSVLWLSHWWTPWQTYIWWRWSSQVSRKWWSTDGFHCWWAIQWAAGACTRDGHWWCCSQG